MRIVIQKFGGTSLASAEARKYVLRHIQHALELQCKLVIVVSAMGRKPDPYATDTLIELIQKHGNHLPPRELDMLLSCGEMISACVLCSLLHAEGYPSMIMNGGQAGIRTDDTHGNARIVSIEPYRILDALKQNKMVIVTGFQGISHTQELTTLGRGGSDTTAAALGVALNAERVDIFTDVEGIRTADPKIVNDTKKINHVSYHELCNLAQLGAKVIHPRAVELVMKENIPMYIRSTFSQSEGTLVTCMKDDKISYPTIQDKYVTAIAYTAGLTQIYIPLKHGDDAELRILKLMASHNISIDFINLSTNHIAFTIPDYLSETTEMILKNDGFQTQLNDGCAKVSVVGGGMNEVPGVMAIVVEALKEHRIEILQSVDSNTTIWVLVKEVDLQRSVTSLHHKFKLNQ
jgi:aspartate kinase